MKYLITLFISFNTLADIDLAQSLLSAFQGGCQSIGAFTSEALGQSNSLRSLIEGIRNDSECKDWAASVELLSSQLNGTRSPPQFENLDNLSQTITELSDMIQAEADPIIKQMLSQELGNLKIESLYLGQNADNYLWENRTKRLSQLNYNLNIFNSSIRANSKCLNKYPGIFLELGGQILSTAGSANPWGAAVGAGLAGVGTITNFLVDLIKSNLFATSLKKLKITTLTSAYMCALETISNTYCNADETKKRIEEVAANRINIFNSNWKGLMILENIFYYNSWMLRVISGTPSGNIATAQIKNEVIELRANYQKDVEQVTGILKEGEQELRNSAPEEGDSIRYQIVNSLVKRFIPSENYPGSGSDGKKTPYSKFFIKDPSCGPLFFYFSPTDDRVSKVPPFTRCETHIENLGLSVPSLDEIKRKTAVILREAKEYVDMRYSLIKETDPELVLLEGEKLSPYNRPSPITLLGIIRNYLNDVLKKYDSDLGYNTSYTISQTLGEIDKALEVINRPLIRNGASSVETKTEASLRLEAIQKILAPDNKDTYLAERLKQVIQFEIRKKLEQGDIPEVLSELVYLALNDEVENLQRFAQLNLETSKYDVLGAMRTSMVNLEVLGKVFDKKLEEMFIALDKDLKKNPGEESIIMAQNRLCILSLSIPQLNKMKFIPKYCLGKFLESIYDPKVIYIKFNDFFEKPFTLRACEYNEYLEKNNLHSKYNQIFSRVINH